MRAKDKAKAEPAPDPFEHFLSQAKLFLAKNGLHLALLVALIAAGVLTYRLLSLRHSTRTLKQWDAVSDFPQSVVALYAPQGATEERRSAIQQLVGFLGKERPTEATPWVMLKLAGLYAEDSQWSAAVDAYRQLIARYPHSAAAASAKEALPVALEELGAYADAAAAYCELARSGPARFLVDAGRAYELAGDPKAAEAEYRSALEGNISEDLRRVTRMRLVELAQGRPLSAPPQIEPPPPAAASAPAETPVGPAAPEAAPPAVPEGSETG